MAPSMASEPELRNRTVSSGSGKVSASIRASRTVDSAKPMAWTGPDEPVDLGVDRRGHARVGVPQRGDGDAVGEVEVGAAARVVQAVADPVGPAAVHVAAQDGRHVGPGEGGEVEGVGGVVGVHGRV